MTYLHIYADKSLKLLVNNVTFYLRADDWVVVSP